MNWNLFAAFLAIRTATRGKAHGENVHRKGISASHRQLFGRAAVAASSGAAFAHGHHHQGDNGGQKTVGIVPQHGRPPLTGGPDYVYRGKDGQLHHSSDGSIAPATTVRGHRKGGGWPKGAVVRDHRNGKNSDCQENPNNPAGFCFHWGL
ncbi:MAG TPA: hypothetical protein VNF49_06410 [Candidatus Binataceae bacterium]|nr:hypothetical protein [Candidatus Binataceae bacterium]